MATKTQSTKVIDALRDSDSLPDESAELTRLRADLARKDEALRELESFIGVMFGRGPDAVIPESVNTPLGIPIKLRAIMAGVTAALADADTKGTDHV